MYVLGEPHFRNLYQRPRAIQCRIFRNLRTHTCCSPHRQNCPPQFLHIQIVAKWCSTWLTYFDSCFLKNWSCNSKSFRSLTNAPMNLSIAMHVWMAYWPWSNSFPDSFPMFSTESLIAVDSYILKILCCPPGDQKIYKQWNKQLHRSGKIKWCTSGALLLAYLCGIARYLLSLQY